eukprot:941818-Pyramimonas_sp.AAC.1
MQHPVRGERCVSRGIYHLGGRQISCGCNEVFKVLGTMITMNGNTNGEFQHRLRAGWAKFSCLSD